MIRATISFGYSRRWKPWSSRGLAAVALPELGAVDYLRLQHRASQQFELVERERLQAVRSALARDPDTSR